MTAVEDLVIEQLCHAPDLQRLANGFRLSTSQCVTDLVFQSCQAKTGGLEPVSIARIKTTFDDGIMPRFDLIGLARLNRRAAFGSFGLSEGGITCELSFSLYEGEPASQWVAQTLVNAFGHQLPFGIGLGQSELSADLLVSNRENLEYPRAWIDRPDPDELGESAQFFRDQGFVSTLGFHGIVLEVPLGLGAASRMIERGTETALLHLSTDVLHPIAGAGYFAAIALPRDPAREMVPGWCAFLNRAEHQRTDFVPRMGAWGSRGLEAEVVYSTFWPATHPCDGIDRTLMTWMILRALWVKEAFWQPSTGLGPAEMMAS